MNIKTNKEIRQTAYNSLTDNWGPAVVNTLIIAIVSYLITSIINTIASTFISLSLPLIGSKPTIIQINNILICSLFLIAQSGFMVALLLQYRKKQNFDAKALISFFKVPHLWATMLLVTIYLTIWGLVLIIPTMTLSIFSCHFGHTPFFNILLCISAIIVIIKSIEYVLVPFILHDYPNVQYHKAIVQSVDMMKGYRWTFFKLLLSFTGWAILSVLTLGIGFLWLYPYVYTSTAVFYEEIRNNYESKSTPKENNSLTTNADNVC